ncbi:MAG: MotA/TolQ/ExbB proton channel family protein [Gammaproteobacteria bacterium]|nr:MotA/TolQ/ExbB proton channel family protein [Gammaproteobacteria bacterium]
MLNDVYYAIVTFMEQGGPVLPLIAVLTFVMWTLIFERFWYFQTEHKNVVRKAVEDWEARSERKSWTARQIREGMISRAAQTIKGSLPFIQTCVSIAPLFGLMGTVTGMVSVFDAMATQGGNAQVDGQPACQMATIPTMAGMVVSLLGDLRDHDPGSQGRVRDRAVPGPPDVGPLSLENH